MHGPMLRGLFCSGDSTFYILNVAEKVGVDIDLQEGEKGIRGTSGKNKDPFV